MESEERVEEQQSVTIASDEAPAAAEASEAAEATEATEATDAADVAEASEATEAATAEAADVTEPIDTAEESAAEKASDGAAAATTEPPQSEHVLGSALTALTELRDLIGTRMGEIGHMLASLRSPESDSAAPAEEAPAAEAS